MWSENSGVVRPREGAERTSAMDIKAADLRPASEDWPRSVTASHRWL